MKKLLLLLGLVVSATAMASVVEVRVGGDLTNRATFKDASNTRWRIKDDALNKGFELAGVYRTEVLNENLEIGGGIAYKHSKLSNKKFPGLSTKGLNSVPLYFTTRYNFKNSSEITPYVKGNLGIAFNSGKVESKDATSTSSMKMKFNSGVYYGVGTGIQYKNFVTDLSYNVNTMKTKYSVNIPGYTRNSKFNTNHGALTLSVGYSFGF